MRDGRRCASDPVPGPAAHLLAWLSPRTSCHCRSVPGLQAPTAAATAVISRDLRGGAGRVTDNTWGSLRPKCCPSRLVGDTVAASLCGPVPTVAEHLTFTHTHRLLYTGIGRTPPTRLQAPARCTLPPVAAGPRKDSQGERQPLRGCGTVWRASGMAGAVTRAAAERRLAAPLPRPACCQLSLGPALPPARTHTRTLHTPSSASFNNQHISIKPHVTSATKINTLDARLIGTEK